MYDLFFLSYNEPYSDMFWNFLYSKFPYAKRVNGIKGILNAHKKCAELSNTSHFFVVDADNEITNFNFDIKLNNYDKSYVHLWYAKNILNNLEYGWGGIKLFPKDKVLKKIEMGLDMTTEFELKIIQQTVSITHFNTNPFNTWRSAFRECAKLIQNENKENIDRLNIWCNNANGMYENECIAGANAGKYYGLKYKTNKIELLKINDFDWLEKVYNGEINV